MSSILETNRYHTARRFLLDGQREWALVIAGELLRSVSGRELALSLLAEMYPECTNVQPSDAESPSPGSRVNLVLVAKGPGI